MNRVEFSGSKNILKIIGWSLRHSFSMMWRKRFVPH